MKWFNNRTLQPNRIKSVRELDPKFQLRWVKLETRLLVFGFLVGVLILLASFLLQWVWLFNLGWVVVFLAPFAAGSVHWGSEALVFLGYWFPRMGVLGVRIGNWLEKDLEWPR